jgi:hypothetical protein
MEKYQPEAHTRNYVKRDAAQARAYSPAVVTQGGKVVWLAGQTVVEDSTGTSLVVEGSSSFAAFAASSSASPGMQPMLCLHHRWRPDGARRGIVQRYRQPAACDM